MIWHYLKIAVRNFRRHWSSFVINLIGLGTGLACAVMIFMWVVDERSFDKFHQNDSRLFQVMKNSRTPGGELLTFEWTPGPLAKALKEDFPEVQFAAGVEEGSSSDKGIVGFGEQRIKAIPQYVGQDFFDIFSYQLIEGRKKDMLKDPNDILIAASVAEKLFGRSNNLIGHTIEWEKEGLSKPYQIAGVFQDPPTNSTARFEVLLSYDLYLDENPNVNQWTYGGPSTYLVLQEGVNPETFDEKIGDYLQMKSGEDYQSLFIRPYSDKYLYNLFENGKQVGGRISYVRLFSIVAIFILIIACINFMNLSTARATQRMQEVGIKKTVGASRSSLIGQFLTESISLSFMALILAIGLIYLTLPAFNVLTGKALSLQGDPAIFLPILGIALLTGLVAGSYPAFYLSGFHPVKVMKGEIKRSFGKLLTRKGLVVFQFTTSLALIVAVWVIYNQIQFIQSKNMGFSKDQVISFEEAGKLDRDLGTFLERIRKIPGVLHAGAMRNDITSNTTATTGVSWPGVDPEQRINFKYLSVDEELIETLGMKMLAGRSFSKAYGADSSKIIFNETAIKQMGLTDPIGKTVTQWGKEKEIIGVVKDFHVESLYEKIKPCFLFLNTTGDTDHIFVKLAAGSVGESLSDLKQTYQKFNEGLPLEYHFLDEDFQQLYESEHRVAVLSRYAAGLAVLISCLGLFGLVSFSAERRRKEISIRKVLGASMQSLVRLLSVDFLKLVGLSLLIAIPLSWYGMRYWLHQFAYRTDIHWSIFVLTGILGIGIAFLTVSFQSIRAALVDPVKSLKSD